MKPPKPITDPSFRYTNAASTDIAATFRRIRREQKAAAEAERQAEIERREKVRKLAWGSK
jgi:hypothetical protein